MKRSFNPIALLYIIFVLYAIYAMIVYAPSRDYKVAVFFLL